MSLERKQNQHFDNTFKIIHLWFVEKTMREDKLGEQLEEKIK